LQPQSQWALWPKGVSYLVSPQATNNQRQIRKGKLNVAECLKIIQVAFKYLFFLLYDEFTNYYLKDS